MIEIWQDVVVIIVIVKHLFNHDSMLKQKLMDGVVNTNYLKITG